MPAKPYLFRLIAPALTLVSCTPAAWACSCVGTWAGLQPCSAYWSADAVFAGEVREIERRQIEFGDGIVGNRHKVVRFVVDEAFRGVSAKTIEIFTGNGGGDCGYDFRQGRRYFVYAYRHQQTGQLWTGICGRTGPLASASADLEYARAIKRGERGSIIFGIVLRHLRAKLSDHGKHEAISGVLVVVEGGGRRFESFTDGEGRFQFSGLPPGAYKVRAEIPGGLRALPAQEVVVSETKCGAAEFITSSLALLTGQLLDAEGKPAAAIPIHLVPADEESDERLERDPDIAGSSDADGRFAISWIPPGRYLLVLNPRRQPSQYEPPYPLTYFPGVGERSLAKVFRLAEGDEIDAGEFRLPPRLLVRAIRGTVQWPDGSPATGTVMRLEHTERSYAEQWITVDEYGRFELQGYEGYRYRIHAEHRAQQRARHAEPAELVVASVNEPLRLVIAREGHSPQLRPPSRPKKKADKP